MSIDISDLTRRKKLLMNVEPHDLIRFSADRIPDGIYMVFDIDKEPSIPALICELWAFNGGFDHAFHRFLENDFNVNKEVDYYEPKVMRGVLKRILSYRDARSDVTDKELFHFDLEPRIVQSTPSGECIHPYEVEVEVDGESRETVIPQWTPLQKLPIDRIKPGTEVEVWEVKNTWTIMKVLKL